MSSRWILVLWLPSIATAQMQCNGLHWLDRFAVVFRTVSDRGGPATQACGDAIAEGDVIRRILYDTSGNPYFGYEIRITPAGDKQYRAEMRPLKDSPLKSFSKFPLPVVVRANEYIDVPVLERPGTSARRTDYLRSLMMTLGLTAVSSPGTPGRVTDYLRIVPKGTPWAGIPSFRSWAETLPSGATLTLDQPHLTNILGDLGSNHEIGVIGPVVWLYREGLGRFLFSASARPGFRKTGLVEGALLRFSDERGGPAVDEYMVGLHSNAVPMAGTWIIWIKHEPEFRQPPGPWTKEELKNGMLAIGVER